MDFITLHFYLIEAIASIVLLILLLLLFTNKSKTVDNLNQKQEKINRKYKFLQQKHDTLHIMLDKFIVERIELKKQINKLSEHYLALQEEKDLLQEKYNTILKTLDTNAYKDN